MGGATPEVTPTEQKTSILDEFRLSLNTVLSDHINKINESLKNVLEEKETEN